MRIINPGCALDRPTKGCVSGRFWILKESCEARCQTRFGLNLAVLAAQISEARTVSDSLRLESGRVSAPPGCALDRPKCRAVSRAAWASVVKPGCVLDRLRAVSRAANRGLILLFLRLVLCCIGFVCITRSPRFTQRTLSRCLHRSCSLQILRFVNGLKFKCVITVFKVIFKINIVYDLNELI